MKFRGLITKVKSRRRVRKIMPRYRRIRRAARTVYRTARRHYIRGRRGGGRRGFGGGGGILRDVEGSLGKGILYQGVAQKFIPTLAPIAGLYGAWKGGGLTGLAVSELFVKPFIGLPSNLGNITGLLGGLGLSGGQSSGGGMGATV